MIPARRLLAGSRSWGQWSIDRLPTYSTVHTAANPGFCYVFLNVDQATFDAFAAFARPRFVFDSNVRKAYIRITSFHDFADCWATFAKSLEVTQ